MATPGRRTDSSLSKILFGESYRFDFFQAVRLMTRIFPRRRAVGHESDASREVVRFRTRVSLTFPPSEIHEITKDGNRDEELPPEMVVSFMGLTGPLGVLPHHYTELLLDRVRYNDLAMWEFLDLFNHRFISLFYRAWEKYRFAVGYELGEDDRFTQHLFDTIGMGTRGLRGRMSFSDHALVYYGGLIAQRPHSAAARESILGDYFRVPVAVKQFTGQWLLLDEDNITRVGKANSQLGVNTIAGTRVWDTQSRFRLRVGPLAFKEFLAFLPVGTAFKPAGEFARLLVGLEFDFDVQLVLKAEEVPAFVLTSRAKRRPMLGWTSWLKTREFVEDDSQVILSGRG